MQSYADTIINNENEENIDITQGGIDSVEYDLIAEISEKVEVIKVSEINRSQLTKLSKGFNCGVDEYNIFLRYAKKFDDLSISKTRLLKEKETGELIGYISLNSDIITLDDDEKKENSLENIRFKSIPALKIGKLAISNKEKYKGKGYGKFLIEIAQLVADHLNETGVACRFLTVDADVQYNKDTYKYYKKLGFTINQSIMKNPELAKRHLISMRKDILLDVNEYKEELEKIG